MPIYGLNPTTAVFPHPLHADPSGILAIDGTLSSDSLINAYRHGIFPWYGPHEPILWWFPNPRCVLWPDELNVTKSMRSVMRNKGFEVTINQQFERVIRACKDFTRPGQEGTWLDEDMLASYNALHKEGYAHSVEVWLEDDLVGGLYGIAMGKIFFGESMFSNVSNASKVGFIHLVNKLNKLGFHLIDCQQDTPHLRSLGATVIPATKFYNTIRENHIECLKNEKLKW